MAVRKKTKPKLKVAYNAPVTLTFSFITIIVLLITQLFYHDLISMFFIAPGAPKSSFPFRWNHLLDYVRLFTHVLGHANWSHLVANLSFILLLGPLLEERYGSLPLLLMITVTAFVTGVLNASFIPSGLMGASGIVFMMILLAAFVNIEKNEIPLTFILIVVLYLGKEVSGSFHADNVSNFAHLIGGVCGSLFGFLSPEKPVRSRQSVKKAPKPIDA